MGCSASRPNTNIITKPQNSSQSSTSLESMASSHSSPPPVSRALSLPTPLVHHPPLKKGDTHHLVSLTSTTYGSLSLIDVQKPVIDGTQSFSDQDSPVHGGQTDSLSPDSVINTWELMDGLDDDDDDVGHDFDLGKPKSKPSFNTIIKQSLTKPLWKHLSEESLLSKLDPNVVSSYRRALSSRASPSLSPSCSSLSDSWVKIPHTEKSQKTRNIVLYFTSLRGIRKTYEDCCCVRMIFRGFRVVVDEKDISMDSMYRTELQSLLGGKSICLPQVFIQGKHVGGVEEIKQLNENGELAKLLKGFPVRDPGIVCEGCGDARFVPCPNCSGSKKVFEEDECRLRRCPDCNENGLIRCRACCSW